MAFVAETGSGHAVTMDGAPEGGGRNLAPRPMEMVLLGTGGCTAYDVVLILRKSGEPVAGCEVQVRAERAATDPKVFTRIHPPLRAKILLGVGDAGKNCRDYARLRAGGHVARLALVRSGVSGKRGCFTTPR
jgi:hypothetical protein